MINFIAHRGYSSKYQENTEEAFIKAVEHGSKGIETDVRATSDGVLVVSHNDEITFEDGTKKTVSQSTFAELSAKPIQNDHTDTKLTLCTFQRYLEICRDGNMICFIEFKGEFTQEMIIKAFTSASEIYDLKMCSMQSFNFDNLIKTHNAFPELLIMLTCGNDEDDLKRCLEYGFSIDMDYHCIDKETVKAFHDKGLKVGLWTANTRESVDFCIGMGVDYIESDVFTE